MPRFAWISNKLYYWRCRFGGSKLRIISISVPRASSQYRAQVPVIGRSSYKQKCTFARDRSWSPITTLIIMIQAVAYVSASKRNQRNDWIEVRNNFKLIPFCQEIVESTTYRPWTGWTGILSTEPHRYIGYVRKVRVWWRSFRVICLYSNAHRNLFVFMRNRMPSRWKVWTRLDRKGHNLWIRVGTSSDCTITGTSSPLLSEIGGAMAGILISFKQYRNPKCKDNSFHSFCCPWFDKSFLSNFAPMTSLEVRISRWKYRSKRGCEIVHLRAQQS